MAAKINICICFDRDNLDAAIVLVYSIISNKNSTSCVTIHIITSDLTFITDEHFPPRNDVEIFVHHPSHRFSSLKGRDYISLGTFLRFTIHEHIKGVDRILYLDADTLVLRDLQDLYISDMRGKPVAAMSDYTLYLNSRNWRKWNIEYRKRRYTFAGYTKQVLGLKDSKTYQYFNAGVLLIDMHRWGKVSEKCLEFLTCHPDLAFLDQDALSRTVAGDYEPLDPRYNAFSDQAFPDGRNFVDKLRGFNREYSRIQALWRSPWIVHFAGPKKPWFLDTEPTAHEEVWWRCAREAPNYENLKSVDDGKPHGPVPPKRS